MVKRRQTSRKRTVSKRRMVSKRKRTTSKRRVLKRKTSSKRKTSKRKVTKRKTSSKRKVSKRRTSRKTSKYAGMSKTEKKCRMYLARKIKINLKEYEKGKFVSRQQALAVSYSQTKKKHPVCEKIFPNPNAS